MISSKIPVNTEGIKATKNIMRPFLFIVSFSESEKNKASCAPSVDDRIEDSLYEAALLGGFGSRHAGMPPDKRQGQDYERRYDYSYCLSSLLFYVHFSLRNTVFEHSRLYHKNQNRTSFCLQKVVNCLIVRNTAKGNQNVYF